MDTVLDALVLESSESLVEWFAESLALRDFDEPTPDVPIHIRRKLTDEIIGRGEESVGPLLNKLVHTDWAVRAAAATALGRLKSDRAVSPLVDCVHKDESKEVQAAAVNALNNIGAAKGVTTAREWLFEEAENDEIAFRARINDFITLGYADKALHQRLVTLAASYNVDPTDIAASCITYTPAEREKIRAGNAVAMYGGLMLTEDEYRSIQELAYIIRGS